MKEAHYLYVADVTGKRSARQRFPEVINAAVRVIAGGCHLNRPIDSLVRSSGLELAIGGPHGRYSGALTRGLLVPAQRS